MKLVLLVVLALAAACAAEQQLPPFNYDQLMADLPSSQGFHPFGFQPDGSDSVVAPPGQPESAFPFSPPPLPPDMTPQQRAAAQGGQPMMLQAQQPQPYLNSFAEVAANAVRQRQQMQAMMQQQAGMQQQSGMQQQQQAPWYSTPAQQPAMQRFFQQPVNAFGPQNGAMPRFQSFRGANYPNGAYVLNNNRAAVFHPPTQPAFTVGPGGPALSESVDAINVSPRFIESMAQALPDPAAALPHRLHHAAAAAAADAAPEEPVDEHAVAEADKDSADTTREMEENDQAVPPPISVVDAKLPRFARMHEGAAAKAEAAATTTKATARHKITKPLAHPSDQDVIDADAEDGMDDRAIKAESEDEDDEPHVAMASSSAPTPIAPVLHDKESRPMVDGTGASLNDGDDESLDSGKPIHHSSPLPPPTDQLHNSASAAEHASALKPIVDADSHKFAQTKVSGQAAQPATTTPTPITGVDDAAITPADVAAAAGGAAALDAPQPANDGKLYKCVGGADSCKVAVNPNDIQWTVKTVPTGSLGAAPTPQIGTGAAAAVPQTPPQLSTNPAIAAAQTAYYAKRAEIEKDKLWMVQVKQIVSNYQTKMRAVQQSITSRTRELGQDRQKIINMLKQEKAQRINAELQIALGSLQKLESASKTLNSQIGNLGKSRSELRSTITRLRAALGKAGQSDFATATAKPVASFSFREVLPSNNVHEDDMHEMQAANDQGHKFMRDIISMLESKARAVSEDVDSLIPPPVSDLPVVAEPTTRVLDDRAAPVVSSHDFEPASEELAFQRKLQSIIARERTL